MCHSLVLVLFDHLSLGALSAFLSLYTSFLLFFLLLCCSHFPLTFTSFFAVLFTTSLLGCEQSVSPPLMYGVCIGMPDLDVTVLCSDDSSCIATEMFVIVVTSEAKRNLAIIPRPGHTELFKLLIHSVTLSVHYITATVASIVCTCV